MSRTAIVIESRTEGASTSEGKLGSNVMRMARSSTASTEPQEQLSIQKTLDMPRVMRQLSNSSTPPPVRKRATVYKFRVRQHKKRPYLETASGDKIIVKAESSSDVAEVRIVRPSGTAVVPRSAQPLNRDKVLGSKISIHPLSTPLVVPQASKAMISANVRLPKVRAGRSAKLFNENYPAFAARRPPGAAEAPLASGSSPTLSEERCHRRAVLMRRQSQENRIAEPRVVEASSRSHEEDLWAQRLRAIAEEMMRLHGERYDPERVMRRRSL